MISSNIRLTKKITTFVLALGTIYILTLLDTVTHYLEAHCGRCSGATFEAEFMGLYVTVVIIVAGLLFTLVWSSGNKARRAG